MSSAEADAGASLAESAPARFKFLSLARAANMTVVDPLTLKDDPSTGDAIFNQLRQLVDPVNLNAPGVAAQARGTALFARLMAVNRGANTILRAHKQACAETRTELEHTHLGLQNLLYEKRHLEREIEKCRQFA